MIVLQKVKCLTINYLEIFITIVIQYDRSMVMICDLLRDVDDHQHVKFQISFQFFATFTSHFFL
jgi:hypothetical protein